MKKKLLVLSIITLAMFSYYSNNQTLEQAGHGETFSIKSGKVVGL
ncbi:hypothetical protein [Fictibacillus nanhaiensis]|nr:hypothetical protein [Fictibacillus nanhaiensis]